MFTDTATRATCQVISLANQKGGVAKSFTTASLAVGLVNKGKRVLVIDNDPQGHASRCLGVKKPEKSIYDVMSKLIHGEDLNQGEGIITTEEGVDLLPANLSETLREIEKARESAKANTVTLEVAECSLYHGAGTTIEGITSVAEAVKEYKAMTPRRESWQKAIALWVPAEEHNYVRAVDLLVGDTFQLDMLSMIPGVTKNKDAMKMMGELLYHFPDCQIKGSIPIAAEEHLKNLRVASEMTKPEQKKTVAKVAPVAERPSLRGRLKEKLELVAKKPVPPAEVTRNERGGAYVK